MGKVKEIRLGTNGQTEVFVACPNGLIPDAGQYLLANDPQDDAAILGTPLYLIHPSSQGFWAAKLHPVNWVPGSILDLVGPLGHGFELPGNFRRLGLAVLGDTVSRLLPLVDQAMQHGAGVTLFTDLQLPKLASAVEVHPLSALPEALDWPDVLALDLPLNQLDGLRRALGLKDGTILPCPAQVLVTTPMPCAGLARCGACAVPGRRGWKLACEDGPVFDLRSLTW